MRRTLLALLGAFAMTAPAPATNPLPLFIDPAKLPSRPELPDPLAMFDGTKVETKEDWLGKRRPELKKLFEYVMYGIHPGAPAGQKVTARVVHEDKQALGGKATLREVAVSIGPPRVPPFYLLVVVPNKRPGPAPAFVGLNFCGNHAVTTDPKVHIPEGWMYPNRPGVKDNKATEAGRGTQTDVWPLEAIIDRGYAVATAYNGDFIPDDPRQRLTGTFGQLYPPPPGIVPPNATATIMGWAWGIERMVDYLTTVPEIDAKRIAVVGHSRLGKTALVAAAFDDRIALAIPHQAGCGGTAPDRTKNPKAETVKRINTSFPHWFCDNFKKFNDDVTRLPFDQHCLVAVCAPRPVLFTNATEDQWADPPGQFDILKAATPVYKLLGVDGLAAEAYPPENKLIDSRLGYWVRPGKHAMTPDDWKTFLAFADKWLK
jgi:hypothetical protein